MHRTPGPIDIHAHKLTAKPVVETYQTRGVKDAVGSFHRIRERRLVQYFSLDHFPVETVEAEKVGLFTDKSRDFIPEFAQPVAQV